MTLCNRAAKQAVIAVIAAGALLGQQPATGKTEMEDQFRRYILEHPEVIDEALQILAARLTQAQKERNKQTIASERSSLFHDGTSPAAGKPDGITVVQFYDYRCGHCRKVAPVLLKLLETNPDVRVVFKELPVLGADSVEAAKASLAAHRQGAHLPFHKALMTTGEPVTRPLIERIAAELKLDVGRLLADMQSPEIREAIERNRQLAAKLEIDGTPAFVIGSEVVWGAVDLAEFNWRISSERAKEAPKETALRQ